MSSFRRKQSSRANGAKSKGPISAEARQKVSFNALRHGLAAKTLVLSNESPERFQSLLQAYLEKFQPVDDFETDLVEQMVAAKWRQRRVWTVETALIDHEMDSQQKQIAGNYVRIDQETRLALAFRSLSDASNTMQLLTRYEARLHRQYEKAFEQLMAARAAKMPIEPSPTNEQPRNAPPPADFTGQSSPSDVRTALQPAPNEKCVGRQAAH